MARFILDVMINETNEKEVNKKIQQVLNLVSDVDFLYNEVSTIKCIDDTNDAQFYCHDQIKNKDGSITILSPMMNKITDKQIENHNELLKKY